MSTNFGTIKTNIGTRVGDTSTSFATTIGVYINQRYKDVLRRTNWDAIKSDYVVSGVSGTSDYTLASNFGKALYVYDTVNKKDLTAATLEDLELQYQSELLNSGTVDYYAIFNTTDSTAASAARIKKLRLWRTPNTDIDFDVPYTLYPADLSSSTDELVLECERAVEYGATSDAWLTKRQGNKAQYFESLYEKEIQMLIWNQVNQPNYIHMMNPIALDRNEGI